MANPVFKTTSGPGAPGSGGSGADKKGYAGVALYTKDMHGPWIVPLMILVGMVAGAVWAAPVAWLRNRYGVNEILSSLMLVYVALQVLDRAIQVHGALGVSQDSFLARSWAHVRTLRLADGPDEVHLETIARLELAKHG